MRIFFIVVVIWNVIVFLLYGIDKWKASHHRYRISEATLLYSAFLFGSIGAGFGMLCFHHKTRNLRFQLFIPIAFLLQLVIVYWLVID